MTTITKTMLITGTAAILALTGMFSAVEAAKEDRRGSAQKHFSGGKHAGNGPGRAGKVHPAHRGDGYRGRSHNNRSVGRGLREVYILGEGASGCSYSYRKWQATGSRYWRSRYYDCRSG
jgi:hypothetical protein